MSYIIRNPIEQFSSSDGSPLDDGEIRIGSQGNDPENSNNYLNLFSDEDLSIELAQPVKTSGGYPVDVNNKKINIYIAEDDYSISIRDRNNVLITHSLRNNGPFSQNAVVWAGTATNLVNTLKLSKPLISEYEAGQIFWFISLGQNTGAVTLDINDLGQKAITKKGTLPLEGGEIGIAGTIVQVVYDGTRFQLITPDVFRADFSDYHRTKQNYLVKTTPTSGFDIYAEIAHLTTESVGPTGSGADNIWSDLDNLPDNVKSIKLRVKFTYETATSTPNHVLIRACDGDESDVSTTDFVAASSVSAANGGSSGLVQDYVDCDIPLNSNKIFKIHYDRIIGSTTGFVLEAYLIGFSTED